MAGTAKAAAAFGNALESLAGGGSHAPNDIDRALLTGASADEIMDAVVESVRPVDGTQDAEAERLAMRDALSETLTQFPDADLLSLTDAQREFAIEQFVGMDVFQRFSLDVGKAIVENAPNIATGAARLKEVRDYIRQSVLAAFRKLRDAGQRLVRGNISRVARAALRDTFLVFEEFIQ